MSEPSLQAYLQQDFPELMQVEDGDKQTCLWVPKEQLLHVMHQLHTEDKYFFEQLLDVVGVDYAHWGQSDWETDEASHQGFSRAQTQNVAQVKTWSRARFVVYYHLLSLRNNRRLRVAVEVAGEPPILPSVSAEYPSALWPEREVYDLFGLYFDGHPDLRRILTDYGFVGHPFRKDFPISGHVQMIYDHQLERVVYEPVNIEARNTIPRVIRQTEAKDAHHE